MILVCGEALIDLVRRFGADAPRPHPGGGPFNTAIGLGRLGADVAFLGRLSTDPYGELLFSALADAGVDLRHTASTDDPTTLARAELDAGGGATYSFEIDGTSAPGLTVDDLPPLDDVELLHLGTLGLVLEPMATALETLATATDDVLVMLDLNVRSALVDDLDAYRLRLEALSRRASVVKASDEDLTVLYPAVAPDKAARALSATSGALVVLTMGSRGAAAFTANDAGSMVVAAPEVEVVDTIGAGDSFNAALADWIHRHRLDIPEGEALEPALRYAVTAAALTCTRAGADPPTREELEAALG